MNLEQRPESCSSSPRLGDRVLLIDDSHAISGLLRARCEDIAGVQSETADSLAATRALLAEHPERFFVAIVDLNLPDASDGEAVDLVQSYGIPAIVLTADYDEATRKRMLSKEVVDYLLKNSPHEIDQVATLVRRIDHNRHVRVLVVDDSRAFRAYLAKLLNLHHLQVLEAKDGREALDIIKDHPGIELVITDYCMPEMDGLALVSALRQLYPRFELAIIGLSEQSSVDLSLRLLKSGANDFIYKPFLVEEFYCRVIQNIEQIELIRTIRDVSVRDYLTGLYNRRYLFEAGETLYAAARRRHINLATVILDIDHFKRVNDNYGHLAGDRVIREVARILSFGVRQSDLIGRYGGEEFCIFLTGLESNDLEIVLERLRSAVEATRISHEGTEIQVTISLGATLNLADSLQAMIDRADACLYQAKQGGRNRFVIEQAAA
ncbi:diguanylate cyclase [Caldichromatium japonicum]|uniref:diguanylate cyclase n=1 Tax=Caldichromatium japonicum TaxID=2699430 RepID=A0A6G7VD28_9GAMM|nr:diguanylate cyclase [Caldichromatium japonicum]QIK37758.1 diguanylate cyclase [Caldichromatium japonicum]